MASFLNTPIMNIFSLGVFKKKVSGFSEGVSSMSKGQLAVDVFQTEDEIVILAPIAGVKIEDIELIVNEDVLTVRGIRTLDVDIPQRNYYAQECFWGEFSRSIILPTAVNTAEIEASFKDGILQIKIPKANKVRMKIIKIKNN